METPNQSLKADTKVALNASWNEMLFPVHERRIEEKNLCNETLSEDMTRRTQTPINVNVQWHECTKCFTFTAYSQH